MGTTPTIYHDDGGITIWHGDCLDVLRSIPDASIDLVVTSPPYNQSIDKFKPSGMHKESRWVDKISSGYFDSMDEARYESVQIAVMLECFRVLRDSGSVFYNHKIRWRDGVMIHPYKWLSVLPFRIRQEIVWARNGSYTLNAKMFGPSDERIYWMDKGKHKWNQDCVSYMTVWNMNSQPFKDHPCVFPLDLPARCIKATTDPGDIVIDPYMGSGTTLLAAKNLGRRAIGCDTNEQCCALAVERVSMPSLDFGDAVPEQTTILETGFHCAETQENPNLGTYGK